MMIFKGRNRVTSGFRLSARPNHNGIDIVGDDDKTVHAVAGGTVGFAGIVDGLYTPVGLGCLGLVFLPVLFSGRSPRRT